MSEFNCLIMGAAGRDFFDFQSFFLRHPEMRVRAFTAAQIPFIEERTFPHEMTDGLYEEDIPIYPEEDLPQLIRQLEIDFAFLSYSDLSHEDVMHKASLVQSCGAGFALLGPNLTQLRSTKPVVAITATRTGAGKSPLTQWLARGLTAHGVRVGVIRHPMPYGDLLSQASERIASEEDLDQFDCTLEEREEFEPYIDQGIVVYAGVDYRRILAAAEAESQMILWDGGNNDYPFLRPDLLFVVVDALRAGHETAYYPGETNFRSADILVISKVDQASESVRQAIRERAKKLNPAAVIVEACLEIHVSDEEAIRGRRALVVEDGPTLTHGGMAFGAATLAAQRFGAGEIVDPRRGAVGTIADAYRCYPHIGKALPALGYSDQQIEELEATIAASDAEVLIDASPASLERLISTTIPIVRVSYAFRQLSGADILEAALDLRR